jgi:hypothetical protein
MEWYPQYDIIRTLPPRLLPNTGLTSYASWSLMYSRLMWPRFPSLISDTYDDTHWLLVGHRLAAALQDDSVLERMTNNHNNPFSKVSNDNEFNAYPLSSTPSISSAYLTTERVAMSIIRDQAIVDLCIDTGHNMLMIIYHHQRTSKFKEPLPLASSYVATASALKQHYRMLWSPRSSTAHQSLGTVIWIEPIPASAIHYQVNIYHNLFTVPLRDFGTGAPRTQSSPLLYRLSDSHSILLADQSGVPLTVWLYPSVTTRRNYDNGSSNNNSSSSSSNSSSDHGSNGNGNVRSSRRSTKKQFLLVWTHTNICIYDITLINDMTAPTRGDGETGPIRLRASSSLSPTKSGRAPSSWGLFSHNLWPMGQHYWLQHSQNGFIYLFDERTGECLREWRGGITKCSVLHQSHNDDFGSHDDDDVIETKTKNDGDDDSKEKYDDLNDRFSFDRYVKGISSADDLVDDTTINPIEGKQEQWVCLWTLRDALSQRRRPTYHFRFTSGQTHSYVADWIDNHQIGVRHGRYLDGILKVINTGSGGHYDHDTPVIPSNGDLTSLLSLSATSTFGIVRTCPFKNVASFASFPLPYTWKYATSTAIAHALLSCNNNHSNTPNDRSSPSSLLLPSHQSLLPWDIILIIIRYSLTSIMNCIDWRPTKRSLARKL